jgi:hypothetical protein
MAAVAINLAPQGVPVDAPSPIALAEDYSYDDRSRRVLAYWMMAILTGAVAFIGGFLWSKGATGAAQAVSVFLTPIIGLVGTVLGFYFGGKGAAD